MTGFDERKANLKLVSIFLLKAIIIITSWKLYDI